MPTRNVLPFELCVVERVPAGKRDLQDERLGIPSRETGSADMEIRHQVRPGGVHSPMARIITAAIEYQAFALRSNFVGNVAGAYL